MDALREWMLRFWGTLRKNQREREMEEELAAHLELAAEDLRRRGASGASGDEAIRAARLHAGAVPQAMEAMRDQRGLPWLDDLSRDIRYVGRSIRQSPVFTVVALLTLTLGIDLGARHARASISPCAR